MENLGVTIAHDTAFSWRVLFDFFRDIERGTGAEFKNRDRLHYICSMHKYAAINNYATLLEEKK